SVAVMPGKTTVSSNGMSRYFSTTSSLSSASSVSIVASENELAPGGDLEHQELGQRLGIRLVLPAEPLEPSPGRLTLDVRRRPALDHGEELVEVGVRQPVGVDRLELELQGDVREGMAPDPEGDVRRVDVLFRNRRLDEGRHVDHRRERREPVLVD